MATVSKQGSQEKKKSEAQICRNTKTPKIISLMNVRMSPQHISKFTWLQDFLLVDTLENQHMKQLGGQKGEPSLSLSETTACMVVRSANPCVFLGPNHVPRRQEGKA